MATRTSDINKTRGAFLPPHSREAEESLLGALMIDARAIVRVADALQPDDFYRQRNAIIYEAMLTLFNKSEPIDIISISEELKSKGRLTEIGGRSYLAQLTSGVPTASHVNSYAKIIRTKKVLRDLLDASATLSNLALANNQDIDEVLDQAEKKVFSIAQRSISQEFVSLSQLLGKTFDRIDALDQKDSHKLRGMSTGFEDLDEILSGLQRSDLVVLAARPSLGKSSLALDIARAAALTEKQAVGIFSLEMSIDQIVERLLAQQAGISLWKLRTGNLSSKGDNNDFDKLREAIGVLSEAPIFIDDAVSATALQMRAMARRLQAQVPLGLLIVDYLQLMQPSTRRDSKVQEITEISRSLKALARELNVPVLAISQLSRAVEHRPDQRPRLSDLRESGSIEQDSDVVLMIYREDRVKDNSKRKNVAEVLIAKHRNGPIGKVELYFDQDSVSFRNLEKRYQEDQFS